MMMARTNYSAVLILLLAAPCLGGSSLLRRGVASSAFGSGAAQDARNQEVALDTRDLQEEEEVEWAAIEEGSMSDLDFIGDNTEEKDGDDLSGGLDFVGFTTDNEEESSVQQDDASSEVNPTATCKDFKYRVKFGEDPSAFAMELKTSYGTVIWDRENDVVDYGRKSAYRLREGSACLEPEECYTVTVYDSSGLAGNEGDGWFRLFWGEDKFGKYNADKDGAFESESYTFGDSCSSFEEESDGETADAPLPAPTTEAAGTADPSCQDFFFRITLDSMPAEVGYSLTDSEGNKIWDEPDPWKPADEYKTFIMAECLDPSGCYELSITDSKMFPTGLVDGEVPGKFTVTWGVHQATYDGAKDGCYFRRWYKFGDGCPFPQTGGSDPGNGYCDQ